jgi:hypothetical protein
MRKTIFAAMTALAVVAGPDALAQQRVTAADLNALTDGRLALVKAALQLTPEQERFWPEVEAAVRDRARDRQARLANTAARVLELQDKSPIDVLRERNPVEFMNRRSDVLLQRAADLKKLAMAWTPLYATLTAEQRRRLGFAAALVLREMRDSVEERRLREDDEECE